MNPGASPDDRSSDRPRSPTSTHELLRRLQLDVTMRLDGLLHGDYRGLVPGHGSDLGETREYGPGDDVRRIDWNVTARMQTPYVRESIADRELEATIVIDLSPSLDFGTTTQEKRDLALEAVGAVGVLTARVGNRVGAVLVTPGQVLSVPAKQGQMHLLGILQRVATAPRAAGGAGDLAAGLHRAGVQARRRGLVVIVSDFLGPDTWKAPLRRLALRHDVLAIEVLDPRELELPDVGVVTLVDPETGVQRRVATNKASVRARYAEAAAAQRAELADELRNARIDHLRLRTDQDWLLALAKHVSARRTRRAAPTRSVG